jgi:hypothetical protein
MQVNDSVDLGGHNTNRNLVATGAAFDLVSQEEICPA